MQDDEYFKQVAKHPIRALQPANHLPQVKDAFEEDKKDRAR